jgi:hypothetical protein
MQWAPAACWLTLVMCRPAQHRTNGCLELPCMLTPMALSNAGFLSARLSFTELIGFGLSLFINASNSARINLVKMGAPGLVGMLIELTRIG